MNPDYFDLIIEVERIGFISVVSICALIIGFIAQRIAYKRKRKESINRHGIRK
jgi:hypothetical protein